MLILKELTVSVPTYIVLKEKVLSILYLLKKDQYKSLRSRVSREYYSNLKDRQFAQHPSTWLNAEGFLNEGVSYKGTLSDDDAKNIILKSKWETSKKYGKLLHNLTQNQFDEMETLYGEK
jgi:hypothetical protein